jgi:cell division septation protein DedD
MTRIEQQRLVGGVLLLLMIGVVSYFLISGANTSVVTETVDIVDVEDTFTSVIEPLNENDVEIVDYEDETLLDPQNLNDVSNDLKPEIDDKVVVENIDNKDTIPTPTPTPTPTPDILPSSPWIVQLGSFSVKSNADALAEQVTKLGYAPIVGRSENNKGTIYRVRLSSIPDKETAEKRAKELTKRLNVTPQVFQQKP